jgi:protein-S-isoprenylcysteine O-methyltransferase Ste14
MASGARIIIAAGIVLGGFGSRLAAVLGTAIATDVFVFIIFAAMAVYFSFSARVEDSLMAKSFPSTYPEYHDRTKMLIPFVL